jgi:phytoene dehydrogenase-like protein
MDVLRSGCTFHPLHRKVRVIMENSEFDVIVVGAGVAGLTASAYLCKENRRVLLLEKEAECGGLLGAINLDGHILDKGARGIIDSGIVFSMLKQLGIEIEFLANPIRITIGSKSMDFKDKSSLTEYASILKETYPQNTKDIDAIMRDIRKVMKNMDVLYGIDNPLFLPKPYDMTYIRKTLLPWIGDFLINMYKAMKFLEPVNEYLEKKTTNKELIQIISQHFFTATPTFFALSYFTLYLQYHYPKGSTQVIVDKLFELIKRNKGEIINRCEVISIDPERKVVLTQDGSTYSYRQLIWAADTKIFYQALDFASIADLALRREVQRKKALLMEMKGADSILTLYVLSDRSPETFKGTSGPHWFYTKRIEGLANISLAEIQDAQKRFVPDKNALFDWIKKYLEYNTFEVSIPSLRDAGLSPKGETGIIISTLFDYGLTKHIADMGYADEFKQLVTRTMIDYFDDHEWPQFKESVTKTMLATPLTIKAKTHSTDGSVTGWSFANHPFPVEYKILNVSKSVKTPIDSIKQAGQWTFNPAGIPVAVMTGKLAADAVEKNLKRKENGKVR